MINRIDQVEQWMYRLGLPALSEQEALYLIDPPEKDEICEVFADLVYLCKRRYENNCFWPDFGRLGLDCRIPDKPDHYRPRIFCIGVK